VYCKKLYNPANFTVTGFDFLGYTFRTRAAETAKLFFQKAFRSSVVPEKVNIDKSGSNTAALKAMTFCTT
jgi:transposase-like protein